MPRKNVSSVWATFSKIDKDTVQCSICQATLSYCSGSTGSMHNHLRTKHGSGRYASVAIGGLGLSQVVIPAIQSTPSNVKPTTSLALTLKPAKAKSALKDSTLDSFVSHVSQKISKPAKAEMMTKLIAGLIAEATLPINLVEQNAFRDLLAFLEPGYILPSQKFMATHLQGIFLQEKEALAQQLRDAKSVALTIDCWTARTQESYMTVTVHFIDGIWQHQSKIVDTSPVGLGLCQTDSDDVESPSVRRHTTDALSNQLKGVIEQWNIEPVISAVVHDNSSNVQHVGELIGVEDVACAAHNIQLSVEKGMASNHRIMTLVNAASRLVTHFRHSTVQMKALESKQKQHRTPRSHLIQCCKTSWNSIFMMFELLLESRLAICSVLKDRNFTLLSEENKLELTYIQWTLMEELVRCLRPLQLATVALSAKYNTSLSTVQPIVRVLIANHLKVGDNDSATVADFKRATSRDLEHRFCTARDLTGPAMMASIFDVRFKGLTFLQPAPRESAYDAVRVALSPPEVDPSGIANEAKRPRHDMSPLDILFGTPAVDDDTNTGADDAMTTCQQEFQDYIHLDYPVSNDSDPCQFWAMNAHRFPSVAKLAKKYLAIPATSVPPERAFSPSGDIITAHRRCLNPENVNMIVFLSNNKRDK